MSKKLNNCINIPSLQKFRSYCASCLNFLAVYGTAFFFSMRSGFHVFIMNVTHSPLWLERFSAKSKHASVFEHPLYSPNLAPCHFLFCRNQMYSSFEHIQVECGYRSIAGFYRTDLPSPQQIPSAYTHFPRFIYRMSKEECTHFKTNLSRK
jgi:hypothetical protein